ncbi:hypothetical protein Uis1B_0870 [Bifidobacterium margollesii]|uniref:Uncharacterized protein n=1 Tax=Bifidobacterium margollesii TaxID=2020964 RepID=A0A2N5JAX1_9BIFI|nr:hypothetical protein [Bifidobacterium margollesii]PLS31354.1 hypothetical protein Uis1B_0870 [Bifidobacterium margollesii]
MRTKRECGDADEKLDAWTFGLSVDGHGRYDGRMAVQVGLEHAGANIVMPTGLGVRGSVAVPRRSS